MFRTLLILHTEREIIYNGVTEDGVTALYIISRIPQVTKSKLPDFVRFGHHRKSIKI